MAEDQNQFIRRRANYRCEYCHLPESGHDQRFSIDHVIARKHGGPDEVENLELSCIRCNLHKGTDLTSVKMNSMERVLLREALLAEGVLSLD
jgi:5-methylcytosine-specific restriction endonuclease McrA